MLPTPLFATPSLRRLHINMATAVGFLLGLTALPMIVHGAMPPLIAGSLATALMVRATVASASRQPTCRHEAFTRTLWYALVFGVLNTAVAYSAVAIVQTGELTSVALAPIALVMGGPAGIGFGLLFGVILGLPMMGLAWARSRPSASAADLSAAVLGVWTLAVAVVLPWAPSLPHPLYDFHMGPPSPVATYLPVRAAACALVAVAGAVLLWRAGARWLRRIRFVQQVARNEHPGWSLRTVDHDDHVDAITCLDGTPATCDWVLQVDEQAGEGAYRRTIAPTPVGRFPSAWLAVSLAAVETRDR